MGTQQFVTRARALAGGLRNRCRNELRQLGVFLPDDIRPGHRSMILIEKAYEEERRAFPRDAFRGAPYALLYPRSFVEGVENLPREKTHDYCFVGAVFSPEVWRRRHWILDFARRRFTNNSLLCISDAPRGYVPLGSFDRTLEGKTGQFLPRTMSRDERGFFDPTYFGVMCRSCFTLCPAGDQPWSMRFFESIMCRSIPILMRRFHSGRNHIERSIPYRCLSARAAHEYLGEWVEANHRLFVERQTLLSRDSGIRGSIQ
jgi:hypothetical protein